MVKWDSIALHSKQYRAASVHADMSGFDNLSIKQRQTA
jgi:hypothetical protein